MMRLKMQQIIQAPAVASPRQSVTTRYKLLVEVKNEVESRLKQSLHQTLLLKSQQEQLQPSPRLWDVEVKIGTQPSVRLLPGKEIIELFDLPSVAGKLLILGAPGSGKTTTLLELATELITRALNDAREPMPVLLNLCSWKEDRRTLAEWLVEELQAKYGIQAEIAQQWLATGQLLPLLDGLDELRSEWQKPCVLEINQFLLDYQPDRLVVCSGLAEYANCKTLLQVNGAIYLLPLSEAQVQNYLWSLGSHQLWQSVQNDPNLLKWAKTPLFLNIIALAAEEIWLDEWQARPSDESRCRYLLDAYIRRQLKQELNYPGESAGKPPTPEQTRHWLSWLSKWLKRSTNDEFAIENMQPAWLPTAIHQWSYRLGVGLIVGLIGGVSCGLSFGPLAGLIGCLFFGLLGGLSFKIAPAEPLNWSWEKASKGLVIGMILGLLAGLAGGLFLAIMGELVGGFFGVVRAIIGGLIGGLIFGSSQGLNDPEIKPKTSPNQGIWHSVSTAGLFTLMSAVSFGVSFGLMGGLITGLGGLGFGILAGLACGGIACLQHFTLRLILWAHGYAPWNYARFLQYANSLGFVQQIGGRYRFPHELLRTHFAAPALGEIVLRRSSGQLVKTVAGHSDYVQAVAISPDGRLVISGSDDKTIKLWQRIARQDGRPGVRPLRTLSGHSGYVRTVAISPDGQLLASGSNDKTIKIWHLGADSSGISQGTPVLTLAGHSNWVRSVAFSPDGQLLASCGDDKTINIWYLRTGQMLANLSGHSDYVRCLAFSPDGQFLASGSDDKTINIWHMAGGQPSESPVLTLEGHSGYVRTLAISRNGQLLVSGSDDQTITVWQMGSGDSDRAAGSPVHLLGGHSGQVWAVAISPDGQTLASSSRDKTIKIWNLSTGELLRTISLGSAGIFSVVFSPDGQYLIGGSQNSTIEILPVYS
ncbi:NACHT domain-containing protein [Microcoleus sp. FACHB-672]|nr:NACHT domain-containing protein [Microcoleus sp. FACHB-672]